MDDNITIAAKTIPWYGPSSGVELWIYSTKPWVTAAGTPINTSSPNDATRTQPYKKLACTVSAGAHTCAIEAKALSSTEDAQINNDVTLIAVFMDTSYDLPRVINGYSVFGGEGSTAFRVPNDPTSTTWADLALNMGSPSGPVTPGDRTVNDLLVQGDAEVQGTLTAPNIAGPVAVAGTLTATALVGNGAGITGLTGATGGVANTGSTTIGADTDVNSVGVIDLQTRLTTRARVRNAGEFELFNPLILPGYATGSLPASPAQSVAYDTDRSLPVFHDGTRWRLFTGGSTIYASALGIVLDSDVDAGGGTDQTTELQDVLDLGASGLLHFVIDGAALSGPLDIYGGTTLEGPNHLCGLFLAASSNRALLRNANPMGSGAPTDTRITIRGLSFNGNYSGQSGVGTYSRREADGTLIGLVQLYGVDDVRVENCRFVNSKSIALHFSNATNVWVDGSYIDNNVPTEPQQGGIQFEGPSSNLFITNTNGNTQDDLIALSTDGGAYTEGIFTGLGPYVSTGAITDVHIKGVNSFGNSLSAVRFFNSTHRLDRVVIDGITGTYATACVWNDPAGLTPGNIGTVSISHVNVHMVNYTTVTPSQYGIGLWGIFDHLILNDITFNDPEDARGHLYLDATADLKHLDVNGLRVYDTTDRASSVMIYVSAGARLRQGDFRNIVWLRGASHARAGSLIDINAGSTMDELFVDGLYANRVDTIVLREASTTTNRITLRNIRHLDPTSSLNRTVANTAGTISLLDVSGWYSDTAGRVYNGGTITEKRGDAFVTKGTATLVAGAVTVAYTDATTTTKVEVHRLTDGGTVGASYSVARTAGTSFSITSKDGAGATQTGDSSVVWYEVTDAP